MKDVVEVCPHCGNENVWMVTNKFDPAKVQYKGVCDNCGKEIFLCDECFHSEDNLGQRCDWHKENGYSVCFRGKIKED
jgi:predicted RNA-binding Zn-ribbon protein involved in translation (DUF1610 family)